MTMTEQEIAEICVQTMLVSDQAARNLNLTVDQVAAGHVTVSMLVTEDLLNGLGSCHGGYIFTLADCAFAFACNSRNQMTVGQHCSITYVNPAQRNDRLIAVAKEISRQGRSGLYDVRITDQDGLVIAEFRGHSRTVGGQSVEMERR
jgi:acyl-CoA thioesterase